MTINLPPLPTAHEMQIWDNAAIELGIPEFTLMENAAREALYVLQKLKGQLQGQHILLFMGGGNNGGDAAALARHLDDLGAFPLILHTKSIKDYTKTSAEHIKLAKALQIPFIKISKNGDIKDIPKAWKSPAIVIDGLLGTGFTGTLRPPLNKTIALINKLAKHSFVLSLDVPSGLNSLSGKVEDIAVKAHATVCFAAAKPALVLPCAKDHVGELYVRNIGIPSRISKENPASFALITAKPIAEILHPIAQDSHKNTWGHVLVVGGSKGMSGAAHLAARAVLRSGAGLVTVTAPSLLCHEIKADIPDIMTLALGDDYTDGKYTWPATLPKDLQEKLPQYSALALGPGFGTSKDATLFMYALLKHPSRPRAVIDADALNILVKNPHMLSLIRDDDIATPHPGEAARLLGVKNKDIQNDRIKTMQKLTALAPCAWILKGAASLLAQGTSPIIILPYDIPNLAVAGSGDVLTGCIAALAARKPTLDTLSIAAMGMTIHANTGFLAKKIFPQRGNMASDLVEFLPSAIANILDLPEVYDEKL